MGKISRKRAKRKRQKLKKKALATISCTATDTSHPNDYSTCNGSSPFPSFSDLKNLGSPGSPPYVTDEEESVNEMSQSQEETNL